MPVHVHNEPNQAREAIRTIARRIDVEQFTRGGARQLLVAARVPALPALPRRAPVLGADGTSTWCSAGWPRTAVRAPPTSTASASARVRGRLTACRRTWCRRTSGAARATRGPRCWTRHTRTSVPRSWRAPTCSSSSWTRCHSSSRRRTSRPGRRTWSRRTSGLAHGLLERLSSDAELTGDEHRLAEDFGFDLGGPHLPFVVIAPRQSVRGHAALAARLRGHGRALATSRAGGWWAWPRFR